MKRTPSGSNGGRSSRSGPGRRPRPRHPFQWLLLLALVCAGPAAAQDGEPWRARLISAEGTVEVMRAGQTSWVPARRDDTFEQGDSVRVLAYSRAAVLLPDDAVLRLDQNTTITFTPPEDDSRSWLDVIRGAIHIITRDPRALEILTPFANAGIEGTEFLVVVTEDETIITVFEGTVAVSNAAGEASVTSGQRVSARSGQLPVAQTVVRPRDAVQWTLYYAPVLGFELPAADQEPSPQQADDPAFYTGRAAARLSVGRVEEARADIEQALMRDPTNVEALSLQSIIALTQNDKDEALRLANLAVARSAESSAALIALSYAQQAFFDVSGALGSLQSAVERDPENALAWARLSELWLAVGDLDQALDAAQTAVSLNPGLARTQTVLGFAYLARVEIDQAMNAFREAMTLDQAAPLPRLGLGLAMIRDGELVAGRGQIEIAVILDPGNALIRSYIGKAYYEEKRDDSARSQLEIAKELDPFDPTPWFYDAIRKQTINQPVEALHDVQESIELNDNRAVYRSRLFLDQDEASRSASLGRIFSNLRFEQLALVEGWKSINTDPGNYSGHRLLADAYSSLPRHEIARVNELFQSQLLQPLNITPVQPQLAETNLFILDTAGPADLSFNEFNPLFNRNRVTVQGSGVTGGNDTRGEDITVSAIADRWSSSVGQFHFETNGFRQNNDLEQDVLNAFVQFRLSEKTTLLGELRSTEREQGDLALMFDPNNFDPNLRQTEDTESVRLGVHHAFGPESEVIGSLVYQEADLAASAPPFLQLDIGVEGYTMELEYLYRSENWRLTSGVRYIDRDQDELLNLSIPVPFPPFVLALPPDLQSFDNEHVTGYAYAQVDLSAQLSLTFGASADLLDGRAGETDRVNPKFGVVWEPRSGTTVRAGAFRTVQAASFSRQDIQPRLEPTQVAGFNQFFFGDEGERAWRYGVAVDRQFSEDLYAGAEFSRRDLDIPSVFTGPPQEVFRASVDEDSRRAYVYWTPSLMIALGASYHYDNKDIDDPLAGIGDETDLRTHRVPLSFSYFHPSGWSAGSTASYVDQKGAFRDEVPPFRTTGEDQFWMLDAFLGYRLPNRHGVVTLNMKNVLDEEFRFQDVDPENPRIVPERLLLLRFTLAL